MSQATVTLLREKFPDAVTSSLSHRGDEVVTVTRESIVEVLKFLRDELSEYRVQQLLCKLRS